MNPQGRQLLWVRFVSANIYPKRRTHQTLLRRGGGGAPTLALKPVVSAKVANALDSEKASTQVLASGFAVPPMC